MTGTQCGLFTHKSVPVIFESPCIWPIFSGPLVVAVKQKAKCTFGLTAILFFNILVFYVCISVCLFLCMSFYLYVSLSVCRSIRLSLYLSISLSTKRWRDSYVRLLKTMYQLYLLFIAEWREEIIMFGQTESGNCRIVFPSTIPAFTWRKWETLQKCHSG
jgi:hypothetical protein